MVTLLQQAILEVLEENTKTLKRFDTTVADNKIFLSGNREHCHWAQIETTEHNICVHVFNSPKHEKTIIPINHTNFATEIIKTVKK